MADEPSRAQPIFVCGLGRSGTTWIANSLGESPELTYIGEAWLIERVDDLFKWFTKLDGEWQKFTPWAMAGIDRAVFAERLGAWYDGMLSLAAGGARYVEKTPSWSVTHLEALHELLPRAFYVLVYRDGRNTVASLEAHRARRGKEFDFDRECRRWATAMDVFQRVRTDGAIHNLRLVRYEDLLENFDAEFRNLCTFVNVEVFQPRAHGPNTSFPDATGPGDFVERWHQWPRERRETFRQHAGHQLVAWGYTQPDEDW